MCTRARYYSDHGNRRRRRRSNRTLSDSSPGLALHLLLHHVQLLEESRAGTLLRPDDDGCNLLSGARKQQKIYSWFRRRDRNRWSRTLVLLQDAGEGEGIKARCIPTLLISETLVAHLASLFQLCNRSPPRVAHPLLRKHRISTYSLVKVTLLQLFYWAGDVGNSHHAQLKLKNELVSCSVGSTRSSEHII